MLEIEHEKCMQKYNIGATKTFNNLPNHIIEKIKGIAEVQECYPHIVVTSSICLLEMFSFQQISSIVTEGKNINNYLTNKDHFCEEELIESLNRLKFTVFRKK